MDQTKLPRLLNEISNLKKRITEYQNIFKAQMINDNMCLWEIILFGPEESLYEGYKFKLIIELIGDYPLSPPNVKFITPIEHVNVDKKGNICVDILKNNWLPSQNIISIMMSIHILLKYPNLQDPFNSELAASYSNNEQEYIKKIKDCCEKYAKW